MNKINKTSLVLTNNFNLFIFLVSLFCLSNHVCSVKTSLSLKTSSANQYSLSDFAKKRTAFISKIRKNTVRLNAIAGNSITFTCSIDLDDSSFSKSGDYKIIWSRQSASGGDFEPLFLDDTSLIFDNRFKANRFLINKETHDQLQWNLIINNLQDSDSRNYICQLNQHPYDIYWLKRFVLAINVPASFINDEESKRIERNSFIKEVDEFETLKIKCLAKGKPKPVIKWFLDYSNGSSIRLDSNGSQISIPNIKLSSRLKQIECQINNGYGAGASRIYRIDIRHQPYIKSRKKKYRVPIRIPELKLRCLITANPLAKVEWVFLPRNHSSLKIESGLKDLNYYRYNHGWQELNSHASYHLKQFTTYGQKETHESELTNSVYTLPLSKYQIFESQFEGKFIDSVLSIKNFNQDDYGDYSCIAINELGQKSSYFTVRELTNQHLKKKEILRFLKKNKPQSNLTRFFEDGDDEIYDLQEYYLDYSNRAAGFSHTDTANFIFISIFVINRLQTRLA